MTPKAIFNEAMLEEMILETLTDMGYEHQFGPEIGADGSFPERKDYREVILEQRLRDALFRINRHLPPEALEEAFRQIITFNSPSLEENSRRFHQLMVEGIAVSVKEGEHQRTRTAHVIDFEHPEKNDFLAVNQFTVVGLEERRPDLAIFVNGLPLVVVEVKSMIDEKAGIEQAYHQIQTYKKDIPSLFHYNAFCILTDGLNARAGTITSNQERYMVWRSVDGETVIPTHQLQYDTLTRGMLQPERLLDIIAGFLLFQESDKNDRDASGKVIGSSKTIIKILAGYHQYFAVKKALSKTMEASSEKGDRRAGVIWHTQGSGKSLTMVFYTAQLIKALNNPTIVVITDRNDLDDQLYATFAQSQELLRQTPKQADVRKLTDEQKKQQAHQNSREVNGLYDLLNERVAGGIIFTTIQKFRPESGEMPCLTDRRNVIIIADEAHRSQYGLEAKTDPKTGEVSYGYAKHLRDALPNASFIGFTGTPVELEDKSTMAVFGDYIDVYDMTRSVEDESTVRIFYENRIIKLETAEAILEELDREFEEITEGQEETLREKSKSKWSRLEAVVGSPNRIKLLAQDIVNHYEEKAKAIEGKAMVVCMSRRICADLYQEIIRLRPHWHHDNYLKGKIKVVMTGSASDPEKIQQHVGGKQRRDALARRMKDPADELKLVLVRDMWLTGFDVPSMHTLYVDKPMQRHNLMQAIARVNRVFKDKAGGVVVDYLGILQALKEALKEYTDSDAKTTGVDTNQVIAIMREKLEVLDQLMHGFDYSGYDSDDKKEVVMAIIGGMNHIKGLKEDEQKEFKRLTVELSKAHALCAATQDGKDNAEKVGYFKAVRASLMKMEEPDTQKKKLSPAEMDARINQLLERSIMSQEIIDVFDETGLGQPDFALLSEDFLEEVARIKYKNLAVEMLRKLLEGNLKSMERTNLVKSEKFSKKLKNTLNQYNNRALTNAQVIEELMRMAKEIKKQQEADADLGLTPDEIAFYDALTADEAVKDFMDNEQLKKLAHELTEAIRRNVTIDWTVRASAQAGMRRIVKRLLKDYDYPPSHTKGAVEIVLQQAELMCGNVAVSELGLYEQRVDEGLEGFLAADENGEY